MSGPRRFSVRHAWSMLAGLALTALGSFAHWLLRSRVAFRASGFGWANWITSVRLVSLLAFAALIDAQRSLWASLVAWTVFGLDGLDGLVARRTRSQSEFGALFDAEVDASFTLLLTWSVFQLGHAGAWVLIGGLLRYGYVLALSLTRLRAVEAPRSALGRYVFALSVGGYTLSLWPFAAAGPALSAVVTLCLCYSFSRSFVWTFCARQGQTG